MQLTRKALYNKTFCKEAEVQGSATNRCHRCGRPRAFLRLFALCRICFRQLALEGQLPGVKKSSW